VALVELLCHKGCLTLKSPADICHLALCVSRSKLFVVSKAPGVL
jgi:hypothetical protein